MGIFLAGALCLTLVVHPNWKDQRLWRLSVAVMPILGVFLSLLLAPQYLTEHRADLTWIRNSPEWRMAHLIYGVTRLHQWLAMMK